jgi:creatinine amidohydrolase
MNWWVNSVSRVLAAIKADNITPRLQQEFYDKALHPIDTPQ